MQDQFIQILSGEKIKIKYILKNESLDYQLIGEAVGKSFNHCLAIAHNNTKGFLSNVTAYSMEETSDGVCQVRFYRSLGKN